MQGYKIDELRQWLEKAVSKKGESIPTAVWERLVRCGIAQDVINRDVEKEELLDEALQLIQLVRVCGANAGAGSRPQAIPVESQYAELRQQAQDVCCALDAMKNGVRKWRSQHLPHGAVLTTEEARAFCASPAVRCLSRFAFRREGIPIVGHTAEFAEPAAEYLQIPGWRIAAHLDQPEGSLPYHQEADVILRVRWDGGERVIEHQISRRLVGTLPFRPSAPYDDPQVFPSLAVPVLETEALGVVADFADESVLHSLWELTHQLRYLYPWRDAAPVVSFILTGRLPRVFPIEWQLGLEGRLVLTVQPWVPEKSVLQAYRQVRQKLCGTSRPLRERALRLVAFVSERRLPHRDCSWESLRREWNSVHPQWAYESEAGLRRMMNDERRARQVLLRSTPRASAQWEGGTKGESD